MNTTRFDMLVKEDTPRLVIMFKREGDKEMFQWGIVGEIPMLSLIGGLTMAQIELTTVDTASITSHDCPESAFVLAWNAGLKTTEWFIGINIPVDSMIGMIETIKATLNATNMAHQMASQQFILGPDGRPARR